MYLYFSSLKLSTVSFKIMLMLRTNRWEVRDKLVNLWKLFKSQRQRYTERSLIMTFQTQYKFASQYPSNSVVWVQNSHNTSQLLISNQFACWAPHFSHLILVFIMQVTDEPETLNLTINNFKLLLWQWIKLHKISACIIKKNYYITHFI